MNDNITPDERQAEISMLNHEIYELNKLLEEDEAERRKSLMLDENDPFDNPTEYHDYNGSYSDIVPQIKMPGCKIPVEPSAGEKKRLRRFYGTGGACIFFHFVLTNLLSLAGVRLVMMILQHLNPDVSYYSLYSYAYSSALLVSVSAVTFLIANVLFTYIGLKFTKLGSSSLIGTHGFSVGKAIQYCLCGIFIQYAASMLSTFTEDVFNKYSHTTIVDDSGFATTAAGVAILIIYQCIIAPITEEMFYRGMVLKVFSRANQRFAIVTSALFFGLAHGNLPQFFFAFLLGMFLAHIDIKHNSILPSVIVHIFVNSIAMIINHFSETGSTYTIIWVSFAYMFLAAIGLVALLSFSKKNMLPRTTPQQSRRGFAVAKKTFTVAAAFILLAISMIIETFSL